MLYYDCPFGSGGHMWTRNHTCFVGFSEKTSLNLGVEPFASSTCHMTGAIAAALFAPLKSALVGSGAILRFKVSEDGLRRNESW